MPMYEYECESCGKKFDRIQKFSDPPIEKCEFCSGKLHKVFSPPVFIFKGSGWYVTDYAKKNSSIPKNGKDKHVNSHSDNDNKDQKPAEVSNADKTTPDKNSE